MPEDIFFDKASPDVFVQLDIGHCAQAGGDPAAFIKKYGDRVLSVHVKDWVAGDPAATSWARASSNGPTSSTACAGASACNGTSPKRKATSSRAWKASRRTSRISQIARRLIFPFRGARRPGCLRRRPADGNPGPASAGALACRVQRPRSTQCHSEELRIFGKIFSLRAPRLCAPRRPGGFGCGFAVRPCCIVAGILLAAASLRADAVIVLGTAWLKRFTEIARAVGEGEALQGSPNGIGEAVRGLDDDGDVGGAGDVKARSLPPHAEAGGLAWQRVFQSTTGRPLLAEKPLQPVVPGK